MKNKDVAQEMLKLFLELLPAEIELIQQTFKQGDHPALLRFIHKLHGALCYCNLPQLRKLVSEIESLLKQKGFDQSTLLAMMEEFGRETTLVLITRENPKK